MQLAMKCTHEKDDTLPVFHTKLLMNACSYNMLDRKTRHTLILSSDWSLRALYELSQKVPEFLELVETAERMQILEMEMGVSEVFERTVLPLSWGLLLCSSNSEISLVQDWSNPETDIRALSNWQDAKQLALYHHSPSSLALLMLGEIAQLGGRYRDIQKNLQKPTPEFTEFLINAAKMNSVSEKLQLTGSKECAPWGIRVTHQTHVPLHRADETARHKIYYILSNDNIVARVEFAQSATTDCLLGIIVYTNPDENSQTCTATTVWHPVVESKERAAMAELEHSLTEAMFYLALACVGIGLIAPPSDTTDSTAYRFGAPKHLVTQKWTAQFSNPISSGFEATRVCFAHAIGPGL